jgi:hybrid cluster-associated redox disulfide protein
MAKKKTIKKDLTFYELIESNPDAARKLAERGMFCGGCPMAMMETIEMGARAHGVDPDELILELNSLDKKKTNIKTETLSLKLKSKKKNE